MSYLLHILLKLPDVIAEKANKIIAECAGPQSQLAFFNGLETYQNFSLALLGSYIALFLLLVPFYSTATSLFTRIRDLRRVERNLEEAVLEKFKLENPLQANYLRLRISMFFSVPSFTTILTSILFLVSSVIFYNILRNL